MQAQALRDVLSMRSAAAGPTIGGFVIDSQAAPRAWGNARHLVGGEVEVLGLFDLVEGRPEDLLDADGDFPAWNRWRGRWCFVRREGPGGRWLAVTDHFGSLPLFHTAYGDRLVVGSQLAPLLALPWCERRVDAEAVFHFLNFGCIPAPFTIAEEIRALGPGEQLCAHEGFIEVRRWWQPVYGEDLDGDPATLAGVLRERMEDTVERYRPRGEARWGCFLSGGTDSSSIVGLLSRQSEAPVDAFSIGFAEAGYDELAFAGIAADAFGANSHRGSIDETETLDVLQRLCELFDQPFGNASAVPTRACAGMAAGRDCSILLAGDGGDEIFGGNERYAKDRWMQAFHALPSPVRAVANGVGRAVSGGRVRLLNRVGNFTRRASLPNPDRFYTDDAFASEHFEAMMGPALASALSPDLSLAFMRQLYDQGQAGEALHRLMALDLEMAIARNDLVKVDGACRHAGISARFPYLDPDLVAFTGRLGARMKLRGMDKRHLFKRAVADLLPRAIIEKPKQGFGLPIAVWIRRNAAFRNWMRAILLDARSVQRGWFQPGFVRDLFERHVAGAWDYSAVLWQLTVLELWTRRNLDA